MLLISSCCADRVNEEYQGEKGPKDRRGNQALPDWISLVPWYVFHFIHPKHGLPGLKRSHSFAAREKEGGFGSSLFCSKSEQMVIVLSLFILVYLHCWKFTAHYKGSSLARWEQATAVKIKDLCVKTFLL